MRGMCAMRLAASYPSPALAWGGWPSRSDGRVGGLCHLQCLSFFEEPPPRLAFARRPSPQGGRKRSASIFASDCPSPQGRGRKELLVWPNLPSIASPPRSEEHTSE